jgi:hypothetical protein
MTAKRIKFYKKLMDHLILLEKKTGAQDYFCVLLGDEYKGKSTVLFCHMNRPPLFASRSLPYNFGVGL